MQLLTKGEDEFSPAVTSALGSLRQLVADGRFGSSGKLPGERNLSERLGFSRKTVREALVALEAEGVVSRSPKRGWFIAVIEGHQNRSNFLVSFTDLSRQRGFRPTAHVLWTGDRSATLEQADALRIPPAAKVEVIERVRMLDDVPICVQLAIVPSALARGLAGHDFERASLYSLVHDIYGMEIVRSSCTLRARLASKNESAYLRVSPSEAVLECLEVAFTRDGTPVIYSITVYRGDAYRFRAELAR